MALACVREEVQGPEGGTVRGVPYYECLGGVALMPRQCSSWSGERALLRHGMFAYGEAESPRLWLFPVMRTLSATWVQKSRHQLLVQPGRASARPARHAVTSARGCCVV